MTVSPELLAAFADGELDAEAARAVEAEIAASPELQAKLGAHLALRERLKAHFAPVSEQPVPEQIRKAVFGYAEPNVVDLAAERQRRRAPSDPRRWLRIAGPALAACLVLALVGTHLWPSGAYARGDLADALDRQLVATQPQNAPVRVLLTFRDAQGQFCRGFASRESSGIACRDARGWRLRKLFDGTTAASTEYQQASSSHTALMTQAQEMAVGPALDAAEETAAMRVGWRGRSSS